MIVPFTSTDRTTVRNRVLAIARADEWVTGGADIGSAASQSQDRWSDIDITFGIKGGTDLREVLNRWTETLDQEFGVTHFFDVPSGGAIYRVILFENGLELDLSVAPETEFGAYGPHFELLFGSAIDRTESAKPSGENQIGWGWHHTLHANAAISRGRLWHAEFWLSSLRNHVLMLRCIRFGEPSAQSRGADRLPAAELASLEATLVQRIDTLEFRRALDATVREFVLEARYYDASLADRIESTLIGLLS